MKEIIVEKIDYDFGTKYNDRIDIITLQADLASLEAMGANQIRISTYEVWGNTHLLLQAFRERLETDEEYEKRKSTETKKKAERMELQRRSELQQLAFLKQKYEGASR